MHGHNQSWPLLRYIFSSFLRALSKFSESGLWVEIQKWDISNTKQ
jgi:hypothetical protein